MKDQNILQHSLDINGSYMSQQFLKFPQIKKGDLISRGNQFRRRAALFVPVSTSPPAPHPQSPSLLLYFSFKHLKDPKSLSFIRFQYILHDSAVLLSVFENFLKVKRGELISWGGNNSAERLNYLVPSFVFQF